MLRVTPAWLGGLAALSLAPAALGLIAGGDFGTWNLYGAAVVLAGIGAMRLTRGRWLSAPFLMLLLSTAGMAAGLAIDRQWLGPQSLAALCQQFPEAFGSSAVRHWDGLRAANLAMLAGGLATIPVVELRARRRGASRCRKAVCGRAGFNLMCNAAMLVGMFLGAWLGPRAAIGAGLGWDVTAMMAAMLGGMAWGMAGVMLAFRAGFAAFDRLHRPVLRHAA